MTRAREAGTPRHVYTVQSNEVRGDGQRKFVNIATWHPTLMRRAEDLREGPVVVDQLFTRRVPDTTDELEIMASRPLLLTWHYVFSAYVPEKRFIAFIDEHPEQGACR